MFTSSTLAVLVTSIFGFCAKIVSVGSSEVFPSVSSPSSLLSEVPDELSGSLTLAVTEFKTFPASTSACVIV